MRTSIIEIAKNKTIILVVEIHILAVNSWKTKEPTGNWGRIYEEKCAYFCLIGFANKKEANGKKKKNLVVGFSENMKRR